MADFPTSKHNFTPFANGATADAAQVTDIYAEVEAIEEGYLNGSARLNSSNSTVANLSVTGGSTFAGTLTLSTQTYIVPSSRATVGDVLTVASTSGSTATLEWQSASQFSTGAVISTGIIRQNSLPAWDVLYSSLQAVAANSSVAFAFDVQNLVRGDVTHSTSANSSRINVTSTGLYMLSVESIVESGGANAAPQINVRFNDRSTNVRSAKVKATSGQSLQTSHLAICGPVRVSSAGYFTLTPFAGDNSTWGSTDQGLAVRFSGYFLG